MRLARVPAGVRRIHLIGVGGSAMAALGGMLAERGFEVSGSDAQIYEPAASVLKTSRVRVIDRFDGANLNPAPDLVVVGNVVTRGNAEAQALLASGIPYLSMPEALWHFFLSTRQVLMVAGTHGKTTSTSIMAHVLSVSGRDPGLLVGGVAKNFSSNHRLGAGHDFVIEGDEYDTAFFDKGPKFLHYRAHGCVLTGVEFDHADIYRDLEHVKSSFRALSAQMEAGRVMAVCADSPAALETSAATRAKRLTFGLSAGEFRAVDIREGRDGARFSIERTGEVVARDLYLPVGGRMNVANALGVYVLLREFGVSTDQVARGLETFTGVVRRQEVIGEAGGIVVIDDFAHHPTAIRATLAAMAARYAGARIVAAFEPRSNTSRRKVFQADFAAAFDGAARVYLGPVYFKDNDPLPPLERLNTGVLAREISLRGPTAIACESNAQIVDLMLRDARPGDVALFMSNGPFDNLKDKFLAAVRD